MLNKDFAKTTTESTCRPRRRPVVFYGAGGFAQRYLTICKAYDIVPVCFADQDPSKQGTCIQGIPVLSPDEVKSRYQDFVLVISTVSPLKDEIFRELTRNGFIQEKDVINISSDMNRMYKSLCATFLLDYTFQPDWTRQTTPTSLEISRRISVAYQKQYRKCEADGVIWGFINSRKLDIQEALLSEDTGKISDMLSNPFSNDLLFGFDFLCKDCIDTGADRIHIDAQALLYRLGEIWGVCSLIYTGLLNNSVSLAGWTTNFDTLLSCVNYDAIIQRLNELFSCDIRFPNPYYGERGIWLATPDGDRIASFRAIQALHQAFTIWEKLGRKPGRVLEIGAGLGRTAYYCKTLFDIDYTIIDLPMTQVASAHFLMQTLGENRVCLYDEPADPNQIKILPPSAFLEEDMCKLDLVVNFDSLTEMDISVMKDYWNKIKQSSASFLSVNHEINEHTVRDLIVGDPAVKTYTRALYGMRIGYAEEYVTF